MNEKNAQLLSGLRDLCAFIEANDDFEFVTGQQPQVEMNFSTWCQRGTDEQRKERLCDLAKRMGKAEKTYAESFFWMRHNFGPLCRRLTTISCLLIFCSLFYAQVQFPRLKSLGIVSLKKQYQ